MYKSAWKSTKVWDLDLCTLIHFPFLVYSEMTCTLICQKQCFYSGSNMLLLLHSKVNTRTTKAGGVSEFLLGREVANLNSSKWRVNKEAPCCQTHKTSIMYDTGGISICDPSPEVSNAFPFNLILVDSYQKGIHEKHGKVAYWKESSKEKGGNVEIKKLCRTLFKL